MEPKHLSALVIALMLAATLPALAADDFTIGQFLQELAKAKHVNATDARIAVESLRAVGIRVPADLDPDESLTEGTVVDIARAAGLRVSTNNPGAKFDEGQVESFFSAFATELEVTELGEDPIQTIKKDVPSFDPFTKGKGTPVAKGHRTPTEPE